MYFRAVTSDIVKTTISLIEESWSRASPTDCQEQGISEPHFKTLRLTARMRFHMTSLPSITIIFNGIVTAEIGANSAWKYYRESSIFVTDVVLKVNSSCYSEGCMFQNLQKNTLSSRESFLWYWVVSVSMYLQKIVVSKQKLWKSRDYRWVGLRGVRRPQAHYWCPVNSGGITWWPDLFRYPSNNSFC